MSNLEALVMLAIIGGALCALFLLLALAELLLALILGLVEDGARLTGKLIARHHARRNSRCLHGGA